MDFLQLFNSSDNWFLAKENAPNLLSNIKECLKAEFSSNAIQTSMQATGGDYWALSQKRYYSEPVLLSNGVLLIPLDRIMLKYDFGYMAGCTTMSEWYEQALADDAVKAIVELVDSPGGQANGVHYLAETKKRVLAKKPIVEWVNEVMASGAMYVGSASSYIMASGPTCVFGSVGVVKHYVIQKDDYFQVKDVYAPTSPKKNHAQREAAKGNEKPMETNAAFLDKVFMDFVQTARTTATEAAVDGSEFFTADAITNGLCDGTGTLQDAINKAVELANTATTSDFNFSSTNTIKTMQLPEIQLGAFMGSLGLATIQQDGTPKDVTTLLSEITAQYGKKEESITTLTKERDDAILAKTTLETSLQTITQERDTLQEKLSKAPAAHPASPQAAPPAETEMKLEGDENISLRMLQEYFANN